MLRWLEGRSHCMAAWSAEEPPSCVQTGLGPDISHKPCATWSNAYLLLPVTHMLSMTGCRSPRWPEPVQVGRAARTAWARAACRGRCRCR